MLLSRRFHNDGSIRNKEINFFLFAHQTLMSQKYEAYGRWYIFSKACHDFLSLWWSSKKDKYIKIIRELYLKNDTKNSSKFMNGYPGEVTLHLEKKIMFTSIEYDAFPS